jgi:MFS family permease
MESPSPTSKPRNSPAKVARRVLLWFIILVALWLLLGMLFGPGGARPVYVLGTGWIQFLSRTVPRMTWNWDLVGMGLLCAILVTVLTQFLLAGLVRQIADRRGNNWRWRWKWTLCGLASMIICFLVGMSIGGIVHQTGWMMAQSESWYEVKGQGFTNMRQLEAALQQALLESDGDVQKVRQEMRNPEYIYLNQRRGEAPLPERFHVLLITDGTNNVVGTIIFPRDFSLTGSQGLYWFEDKEEYFQNGKLPELIKRHQNRLLAL